MKMLVRQKSAFIVAMLLILFVFASRSHAQDSSSQNDMSLSIIDSPDPVPAGGIIQYVIKLRNRSNNSKHVDVTAELDNDMTLVSAQGSDSETNSRVWWKRVKVQDDDTETLELSVRIKPGVRDGKKVTLDVRTDGERESEDTRIRGTLVAAVMPYVPVPPPLYPALMPQTGVSDYLSPLPASNVASLLSEPSPAFGSFSAFVVGGFSALGMLVKRLFS